MALTKRGYPERRGGSPQKGGQAPSLKEFMYINQCNGKMQWKIKRKSANKTLNLENLYDHLLGILIEFTCCHTLK